MNWLIVVFVLALLQAVVLMVNVDAAQAGEPARSIVEAHASGGKVANPSAAVADLTLDRAYEIQAEVIALEAENRGGRAGFKAAMTGKAAQKKFNVSEPTYGVLLKDMLHQPGISLKISDFHPLLMEVEIALFIGRDITEPLADLDEAKAAVEAAAPAIELPEMRMADVAAVKVVDVVADNANAAAVIVGRKADLSDPAEINQVRTRLFKDGQVINEGSAVDSMGDQFKTLMWLAEAVTSRGGKIEKGQLVITGALGGLLPAQPGRYLADYGDFGRIEFTLE